jgi:hypothetical protein
MFLESFWLDNVELYNNQGPIDGISTTYSPRPEDLLRRERPAEKEDHGREEEWLKLFTSESKACTKPEETSMDGLYLCIEQLINHHTVTELKLVEIESQKMEAEEQKMENSLEVLKIKQQIKAVEKAKEQAELQVQMGKDVGRNFGRG